MANNPPSKEEFDRLLKEFGQSPKVGMGGLPILGQSPKSTKRWQCPRCKIIVPASPQLVRLPESEPFEVPADLLLTVLPGELRPVFLCSACDVEFRRKLIPHLQEIDEDGNVTLPALLDDEDQS